MWGWRHQRQVVPVGVAVVLAWGFVAGANDDTIEGYNVAANVAHRISADDAQWLWFEEEGMPESDAFDAANPYGRQAGLIDDPVFWTWSATDGPGTYARFLLGHPLFTFSALHHMLVDGGIVDEALVDHTNSRIVTTPGPDIVWPREASWYTGLLAAAALLGSYLVFLSGRLDRRWLLPGLLAASSIPHAMLAYHASPFEIARHGVILSLVLVVAGWWVIALVADAAVGRRMSGSARSGRVSVARRARAVSVARSGGQGGAGPARDVAQLLHLAQLGHHQHGAEHDPQIEPQRGVVDVVAIPLGRLTDQTT